jgi:SAM-dependent methyltransferase
MTDNAERRGSPDRFGYEWNEYSELRPEYEDQFLKWTSALPRDCWRGRIFLDVGCGMGRNSHWPMTYGASGAVAIDVDERSLAMAKRTLAAWPSVAVRHMSAYEIEYENAFDVVFSIGVIHHLADPARALRQMAKAAKPGGRVLIWVYGYEGNEWIVKYFDPLRRALFARLPIRITHALSFMLAAGLWLTLRAGFGRLEYFDQVRRFSFRHLRSIVFDQMLPKIANYWRREEVLALVKGAGLSDIQIEPVNGISWSAVGTKTGRVAAC